MSATPQCYLFPRVIITEMESATQLNQEQNVDK